VEALLVFRVLYPFRFGGRLRDCFQVYAHGARTFGLVSRLAVLGCDRFPSPVSPSVKERCLRKRRLC